MNSNIKLNSSELLMLKMCEGSISSKELISKLLAAGIFKSFGYGKNLITKLKSKNLLVRDEGKIKKTIQGIKIVDKYV